MKYSNRKRRFHRHILSQTPLEHRNYKFASVTWYGGITLRKTRIVSKYLFYTPSHTSMNEWDRWNCFNGSLCGVDPQFAAANQSTVPPSCWVAAGPSKQMCWLNYYLIRWKWSFEKHVWKGKLYIQGSHS